MLVLSGCTGIAPIIAPSGATSGALSGPASVDPGQARQQLATLTVAAGQSMAGYSRTRFPHWIEQGHGCNTRDVVLERQGTGVSVTSTCKITHGTWVSPYDDKTWTDPQKVDIDHLVPLANAWRSGANTWTDAKRQDFANDLTRPQLIAVTLTQNRAKGDQDPAQWKPPNHAFWCQYAEDWIAVKRAWALTITVAEKAALTDMLGTCA
jgi:Protein of unknown function (DUF1524)